jgi:hypothetical protein
MFPIKRLLLILITTLTLANFAALNAQNSVNGELSTKDTAQLQVIRIYPDSFPNVSVIFRAATPDGQPLWNLNKDNVAIKENDLSCAVVSVKKISNTEAINTALVIDHSGSMLDNPKYYAWIDSTSRLPKRWRKVTLREYTHGKTNSDSIIMVSVTPACPAYCLPPIEHAKAAAKAYLTSLDSSKDKTCLVGFSDVVSERENLSFNRNSQRQSIQNMVAGGGTAFYDAVYTALDDINNGTGIKAVVAMTDGVDNSSTHSLKQVIKHAKDLGIPVYVVGLGGADQKILKKLAKETGGEFYFTNDASQLSSIYLSISKRIKSVYELVYTSPSLSSADSTRDVELYFQIGNDYLKTRKLSVLLPESVMRTLEARELALQEAAKRNTVVYTPQGQPQDSTWPYAAGIAVGLGGLGMITARYYKNKAKNKIVELINVYPNPTIGPVTLVLNTDISAMPGMMNVTDVKGQVVFTAPFISGSALDADISGLENGIYFISVQAAGVVTGAKQVVVAK